MQADFVFAAPDNDLVGTLERQGSDWLIQPAEEPVDDVTGVAGY